MKIKVGLIGVEWYGMVISEAALDVGAVEFVAACDADSDQLNDSADKPEQIQGTRPSTFKDYRDLFDMNGLEALSENKARPDMKTAVDEPISVLFVTRGFRRKDCYPTILLHAAFNAKQGSPLRSRKSGCTNIDYRGGALHFPLYGTNRG